MIDCYGLSFPDNSPPASIELKRFDRAPVEKRYQHLRNAIDLIWNEPRRAYAAERKIPYDPDIHDAFIWNEWTEDMMESYCLEREVIVSGPGASYKTGTMAMFKLCRWLCSPQNTRVILTSTTSDGLRARVWKELVGFWRAVQIGNLVQHRMAIQFMKGDDGAGIFGIAVESDGDVKKAVYRIQGRHNANMEVGVDEMPTVSDAIVEACVNLETGCERFQMTGIGNAASYFDPHGKMAEPIEGWPSVSVNTRHWRAKSGAYVIHLYGPESPRARNPAKFPGMICQDDIDRTATKYGENSPQMWSQRYGFWAPEGITKTVLSETMIAKFKAREKAIWVGDYKEGAGLDPAFEGGDRCILRIGRIGKIDVNGEQITAFDPSVAIIPIKLDVTIKEPIHYQIVRMVKQECEDRGIPKEMFALDTTGEGGGLAAIFTREWGPGFLEVEFGGRATDNPVSENDPTPASKEYLYRVTELWFNFRVAVQNGQVRGLDDETAVEFCKRFYEMVGNLIRIEPKSVTKLRTGKSPDLADACVVLYNLFRERSKFAVGQSNPNRGKDWTKLARRHAEIFEEANAYVSDEEGEVLGLIRYGF